MMHAAMVWKWPGAQIVTDESGLLRWDGPMARPSDAEITQAVAEYTPLANQIAADARVDAHLDDSVSGDAIAVLLEQLPAMVSDAQAGKYDPTLWAQKIRGRLKSVHRAKVQ